MINAAVDFPGLWHDSSVVLPSGLVLDASSDHKTPRGYVILEESLIIVWANVTNVMMLRGGEANKTHGVPMSALLATVGELLQRAVASEQQSVE